MDQIQYEVILEGPEGGVKEALAETMRCTEKPWDGVGLNHLRVITYFIGVRSLVLLLVVDNN